MIQNDMTCKHVGNWRTTSEGISHMFQQLAVSAAVGVLALVATVFPALMYRKFRHRWRLRGTKLAFLCLSVGVELPVLALILALMRAAGWLALGGSGVYVVITTGSFLLGLILVSISEYCLGLSR